MKLTKYKLGEIGKIVTGKTPRTAIIENYGGDVPFLTPTDDLSAQYVGRTNKTLSPKGINEVKNCLLPPNTICVSCIGSNLGEVVITKEPTVTNQQFNSIIIHPQFDAQYIYYVLTLQKKQLQIIGNSATAVPIINKTTFENYEVVIHDNIADQRRIASVLSNLDRKIALNRQINTNLEALARQLYDYWFVQFDFPDANGNPYKSSGGKMTYNEKLKRPIPDGWEVKKLKDCIEHINTGLNPRDNFVFGGDIRYITVKNLTTDGVVDFSNCDYINEEARIKVHRRSQIEVGDILYASICPLGRTYLITSYPKDWDINESVFSIRPNKKIISSEYLDLMLKDDYYIRKLTQSSTGSIFQGIRIHELETTYILVPKIEVINDFSKSVYPLISHKSKMVAEISSLTRQRDELLPLLMNGQITVE